VKLLGGVGLLLWAELSMIWLGSSGDGDAYSRQLALTRGVGWSALITLCLALSVTPVVRLLSNLGVPWAAKLQPWRRSLGVAAGSGALMHAWNACFALPNLRATWLVVPQLRAGAGALLILTLLLLTSFPRVVQRLHFRSWKELHRLAYVALGLALIHTLFSPFAPLRAVLLLVLVTFAIGGLRALPRRVELSDPANPR
jgi:sulfoxide reductase heme-binding subunit YedZ